MVGFLIGVSIWMALAITAAIVFGRVARRGDSEELGSTETWNTTELDVHLQHD